MDLPRRKVPVGEMAEQRRRSRRSLAAMLVSEHQPSRLQERVLEHTVLPAPGAQLRPAAGVGTGISGPGVLGKPLPGLFLPSIDWGTLALRFLCILGQQLFPSCTCASSLPVCCVSRALITLCVWSRGMCWSHLWSTCPHQSWRPGVGQQVPPAKPSPVWPLADCHGTGQAGSPCP